MEYQILIILILTSFVLSSNFKPLAKLKTLEREHDWFSDVTEEENNEVALDETKVCTTNDCKALAKEFLSGMNKKVDPCDDFYDFVCGAWEFNFKLPSYTAVWSRSDMFEHVVHRRIKGILGTRPTKYDILPVRQAKKWYRACMDLDVLEKRGIKPLESILMQLGGWPMTIDYEEWDEGGLSWQRIEQYYFHLTGSYIFYKIGIPIGGYIILSPGPLPLANKLPLKSRNYTGNTYNDYLELIQNIAKIFVDHNSANVSAKMIKKDVEDLINFERKLYKIPKTDRKFEYPNTIGEFIKAFENYTSSSNHTNLNKINIEKLLKNQFDLNNLFSFDLFTKARMIGDNIFDYLIELTELLNNTPKRTIVYYIHWHFASDMLIYTTEKMRNIFFQYMENEYGVTERQPRWLECIQDVQMNLAKSYIFVTTYFSKETEKSLEMVNVIKKEMKTQIMSSNWMNQETKEIAIAKLQSIQVFFGIPDWFKNKTHVVNSYRGLIIGYEHFDNVLSYKKYLVKQEWREKLMKNSHSEYKPLGGESLIINAFYDPIYNHIELPAANFQTPLFAPSVPSVINYGVVGNVIGHEIGHAYDVYSMNFATLKNYTEISKKYMDIYYERTECFLDQFNNYYGVTEADYPDTTPRQWEGSLGRQTRGENMADTIGLHSVFKSYQNAQTKHSDVSKLPGFEEYNDDQMFFISFAASWCEMATAKYYKKQEEEDSHSPARLRVIGTVSNSYDFSKAFNCPVDSPMNPEVKCNIWTL